jgi:nucleotidyltransferase substrate binding protein (TIGR01987 family)
MKRLEQARQELGKALTALDEAVGSARTDLEVDGTIQRFEFTYELFWKLLKVYMEDQGLIVKTPRECFKEGFRLEIIEDEKICLRMIDDRNLTVHLYDRKTSREVFERIRGNYLKLFRESLNRLATSGTT